MLDRFDEAWPLGLAADERLRPLRGEAEEIWLGAIAALEGDHQTAAHYFRRALKYDENSGNDAAVAGLAPLLARELYALDCYDEAGPLAELGRRVANESDVWAQALWRQAQALLDAAAGRNDEAERLAGEAIAIADRTDALNWQGDAHGDLAHGIAAAGRTDEANAALEHALDRYERKHNLAWPRRYGGDSRWRARLRRARCLSC